ncbi:MAG: hypothetical protein F6J87_16965 [Spirulina sp. SIO3F2]|nr:hypothetical protein [Spirulina sp. SIO3F2]
MIWYKGGEPQVTWDVYGLAALMYFAVTGQKPETAMRRKLLDDVVLEAPKALCRDLI